MRKSSLSLNHDSPDSLRLFIIALVFGFAARIYAARLGFNFDMDSWGFIAKIMNQDQEIYSEAGRYNYGPIWAYILHFLEPLTVPLTGGPFNYHTFHWVVAGFLSFADLAIACLLRAAFGTPVALVFYLCPITILITGFHSQFDNLAVLLGLGSWIILRSSKKQNHTGWFLFSAVLMGLSLITKHILAFFPFWILFWPEAGTLKRRAAYFFISIGLFIVSFVPWAIHPQSLHWIIINVFHFESRPATALFPRLLDLIIPAATVQDLLKSVPILSGIKLVWLALLMLIGRSAVLRKQKGQSIELYFIYLLAFVALAPGATDEYLVIPMIAIALHYKNPLAWLYMLVGSVAVLFSFNNVGGLAPYLYLGNWMDKSGLRHYHALIWLLLLLLSALYGINPLKNLQLKRRTAALLGVAFR